MGVNLGRGPRAATALTLATSLTLTAEVLWAARRRLPVGEEVDATGLLFDHLPGAPLRVVVLGDSTLTGPGLISPEDVWVRQALAVLDLGRPIEVVSFAVGGSRAVDVLGRLDAALAEGADAVVLAVGSNDAIHGTPRRRFVETYDRLLGEILRRVPVVAVTNVGELGHIARIPRPLRTLLSARGHSFCRAIESVVARHARAVLLDVSPANHHFRDRSLFGPDLFHPTSAGHSRWAEAVAPGLLLALSRLESIPL